jgi:predicted phage tail protein
MKTIVLLGELGRKFGRKHMLDVKSPAEAIRALCANFKDFASFVASSEERNVAYRVINVRDDIGEDELHYPAGRMITIAPVVAGALPKWLKKVLIGTALIAASFLVPGLGILAPVAFNVGVSMALGGVAELLTPVPKAPAPQEENQPSYIFNGPVNTTAQGHPVPVGYGRMIVGSAVISAGFNVTEVL